MKKILACGLVAVAMTSLSGFAEAKGCLKGAAVGGVGGHVAGHHALLGAAAGCAVGHHMANKKQPAPAQGTQPAPAQQSAPPAPASRS